MKNALDVHRELLGRDIPHEMVRLPGRATSADELPLLLGLLRGCVTTRCYAVTRDEGEAFVAVLVPAGRIPDPSSLLLALGARAVSPARPDAISARTDYLPTLVGPFCLPPGVELLADAALGESDVCYCPVGEPQVVLGIRTRDLLVATGARVATLTGPAPLAEPAAVLDLVRAGGRRTPA